MIKDYPAMFDNRIIPFFYGEEEYSDVASNNTSESGKKLIQITRKDILSMSCSFTVIGIEWVIFFKQFKQKDSFVLSIYDPMWNGYVNKTVHMTKLSYFRRKDSEKLPDVEGVWDISFGLEEL